MTRRSLAFLMTFIVAVAAHGAERRFEVRLIEPASHANLLAGSTVPIAWQATNAPEQVEEWEAFLSIDGGRTYPIRITPHLDATIRRFTWTVPSLPSAEVSILLRFGNEREESEFAFSTRGTIRGTADGVITDEIRSARQLDDHGRILVAWVDGTRDGSDLEQVSASSSRIDREAHWSDGPSQNSLPLIDSVAQQLEFHAVQSSNHPTALTPPRAAPIFTIAILTLACRCNV